MANSLLVFLIPILITGLAILLLVITWQKARAREARAVVSYPPEGQFLTVDGHRVHVVIRGSGPDLVLIHGASGSTRDFTFSLAEKLSGSFRVIVFDRPGLGYSDRITKSGASLSQQADVLAKAAAQLGANRPIVLGQSYGGAVALAWAVHHPDTLSALIPVAAVSNVWQTPLDRYYRTVSDPWFGPLVILFLTAYVSDRYVGKVLQSIFVPQDAPSGYGEYVGTGLTLRRGALRANALQRANLIDEITALYPFYKDISVPCEIVHGDADTTVPAWNHAQRLVTQIPNASLRLLPGIGHMPHHSAETDVIQAIYRVAKRAEIESKLRN